MIRILNSAKFLRHTLLCNKNIVVLGRLEPMYSKHTYCRSELISKISFNNKESIRKTLKYLTPVTRFYSSELDQGNTKDLIVKHDPVGKEFYINVVGLGIARVEYERQDQLIILKHTDVPSELGGRGIGKILAKEALEYVAKNDLQLEIQCSFIRNYVSKYDPKYIKYIQK